MRLVIAVLATVFVMSGAGAGVASAGSTAPYYVALGDSRAAAPTWTSPLFDDHCGRTPDSYPARVAAILGVTFRSVACVGATTSDLLHGQQLLGLGPLRPPQVDALSSATRLVTLSVGGNDLGWSTVTSPCFPLVGDGHCRSNARMEADITAGLAALGPKLDTLLTEVRRRSPDARIVVVGHGGYFGAKGCPPDVRMSTADAPTVAAFFDRLNAALRAAAGRHGALFVDVAGPAIDHDACENSRQRWFLGDWPHGASQTRHPTPLGSANMARLVVEELRRH